MERLSIWAFEACYSGRVRVACRVTWLYSRNAAEFGPYAESPLAGIFEAHAPSDTSISVLCFLECGSDSLALPGRLGVPFCRSINLLSRPVTQVRVWFRSSSARSEL
jgi:hypothetical protein